MDVNALESGQPLRDFKMLLFYLVKLMLIIVCRARSLYHLHHTKLQHAKSLVQIFFTNGRKTSPTVGKWEKKGSLKKNIQKNYQI